MQTYAIKYAEICILYVVICAWYTQICKIMQNMHEYVNRNMQIYAINMHV